MIRVCYSLLGIIIIMECCRRSSGIVSLNGLFLLCITVSSVSSNTHVSVIIDLRRMFTVVRPSSLKAIAIKFNYLWQHISH